MYSAQELAWGSWREITDRLETHRPDTFRGIRRGGTHSRLLLRCILHSLVLTRQDEHAILHLVTEADRFENLLQRLLARLAINGYIPHPLSAKRVGLVKGLLPVVFQAYLLCQAPDNVLHAGLLG